MQRHLYMAASVFFFSSRRRHTRLQGDWSSDVCSSDLQAATNMRFKMPEGYVFIPWQGGNAVDPPSSVTQSTLRQLINGQASIETVDAPTQQKMLDDMAGWHVQTVIVGPMAYQNEAVALYSELLNRQPEAVGDVYVWWGVDASHG